MKFVSHPAMALTALACVVLSGCSSTLNTAGKSDFACDTNGACPTPLEVYQDTHATPRQVGNGRTPDSWKAGADKSGKLNSSKDAEELRLDLAMLAPSSQMLVAAEPPARPLREASQVMRIWIAPWIDTNDNLNWSGYVYTEVTPKRWSYGEQEVRHQGVPPSFIPR